MFEEYHDISVPGCGCYYCEMLRQHGNVSPLVNERDLIERLANQLEGRLVEIEKRLTTIETLLGLNK